MLNEDDELESWRYIVSQLAEHMFKNTHSVSRSSDIPLT